MNSLSVIALGALLVMMSAPSVLSQSLGELARREAARRSSIAQPAKVYTNDSLRVEGTSKPPSRPATQSPAAQPQSNPATQLPSNPATQDEAAWRARVDSARADLRRANILEKALQSYVNALSNDFASRDDPAQRGVIATDRQNALAELERTRQQLRDLEKTISDIEEEARRAGVPPAWVR